MSGPTTAAETTRLIKFDGDETKWAKWNVKALAFAKSKGFKDAFLANTTVVFSDALYAASPLATDVKDAYDLNDQGYQFLILSCSEIAFGLVNLAKTTTLADGDARLAWKNLNDRYAPQGSTDLIHLTGEFNNCCLESATEDPDLWFIRLEVIRSRLSATNPKYTKEDYEVVALIVNKLPTEYSELRHPG
jgi:hypothetical protein